MATIKANWKELHDHGIQPEHLIRVEDLGKVGFSSEIIQGMLKYEIFPQAFLVVGVAYVLRDEIFKVVHTLLGNALKLYESVEESEKKVREAAQLIEENAVPITEEDFQRVEAGEVSMVDLITTKHAAIKEAEAVDG
jgi:hypothetical protein